MIRKLLSTIGIGSARVETTLKNPTVEIGSVLEGEVHVKGGKVRQEIDGIEIKLVVTYYREQESSEIRFISNILNRIDLRGYFEIEPNKEKIIPFKIDIPYDTPVSIGECRIDVVTKVDIEDAPDPKDLDPIHIFDKDVEFLLKTIEKKGYVHKKESGMFPTNKQTFFIEKEDETKTFMVKKDKETITIDETNVKRSEITEDKIIKVLKLT